MSKLTSKVTIAADLAKDVFEIAVANAAGKMIERRRMSRVQFERFWHTREPCRVVMEVCGGAHDWARSLLVLGFEVMLLPAHYVRPYWQPIALTATRCSKPHVLRASNRWPSRAKSNKPSWRCTACASSGRRRAPCGSMACVGC